jgi:hypothetical protein
MWVCFINDNHSSSLRDFPNEALIWNWKTDTWGHRDLVNVPHIGYGKLVEETSEIIDDQTMVIDTDSRIIDGAAFAAGKLQMVGIYGGTLSLHHVFYQHLQHLPFGNLENETGPMETYTERVCLAVTGQNQEGAWVTDPTTSKYLRRVWPKIEGDGIYLIELGAQKEIENSTITWETTAYYTPGTTPHIDCRIHGVAFAIRMSSVVQDAYVKISGFVLDMEILGGKTR